MNKEDQQEIFSKVPAVTFVFWVIKVLATTLGETGGDTLSMSMNLGYLLSTGIFSVIFVAAVIIQVRAKQFHPGDLLGNDCCHHDRRDYFGRSCGPVAGDRLCRRNNHPVGDADGLPLDLEAQSWFSRGGYGKFPEI